MEITDFIEKYESHILTEEILQEYNDLVNQKCKHEKTYYSIDIGKDKCCKCQEIVYFINIKKSS